MKNSLFEQSTTWKGVLPLSAIVLGFCLVVTLSGCGTTSPETAQMAHLTAMGYYGQPNTAKVLHVKTGPGGTASLNLSGDAELTLNTPVPPKNIIPRDPGIINKIVDGVTKLGIGYFVGDAFKEATQTRVVNQPSPLVVEQQVPFLVPAATP